MDQEQIMQIQMMEQESQQLNQQLQLIDQNINEMQELELSLDALEDDKNKEILTNIGKKIYLPVEIKDKDVKLIVEIGKGNFVKKSVSETKQVVQEQIAKLIGAKTEINQRMEEMQSEMIGLMTQIEKEQTKDADKKETKKTSKKTDKKK